jgi:predicted transcriptional regulator
VVATAIACTPKGGRLLSASIQTSGGGWPRHRKLSQAELAAMVGTSKSAIYHYEHGNALVWPSLLSALASSAD